MNKTILIIGFILIPFSCRAGLIHTLVVLDAADNASKAKQSSDNTASKVESLEAQVKELKELVLKIAASLDAKDHTIHRSQKVRHDFMLKTGYPRGRPGWIIDHVIPLHCGGADAVSNLSWQTVVEAKKKDVLERDCRNFKKP